MLQIILCGNMQDPKLLTVLFFLAGSVDLYHGDELCDGTAVLSPASHVLFSFVAIARVFRQRNLVKTPVRLYH